MALDPVSTLQDGRHRVLEQADGASGASGEGNSTRYQAHNTPFDHIVAPGALPTSSRSLSAPEIVLLTLMGVMALCGVSGTLYGLSSIDALSDLAMVFPFLSLTLATITSAVMVLLRDRSRPASAWLATGVMAWFAGTLVLLGCGGFTALSPGSTPPLENLGFSAALCFAPGGVLSLLGLSCYGYDRWLGRRNRNRGQRSSARRGLSSAAQQRVEQLRRVAEYQKQIERLIKRKQIPAFAGAFGPAPGGLERWAARLRQLARRLDLFEADPITQRDLQELPATLARLEAQLAGENDPRVRAQLEQTLASYQNHRRQLDALAGLMRRTGLEIDQTLAFMGAIYSQLQLLNAQDVDSGRARRLGAEIEEQVRRLDDLLSAVDELNYRRLEQ